MRDDEAAGPLQFGSSKETLSAPQVRQQHSALLLRLLWRARESSRADLARATGLSRATISAIVADLLESDLVKETRLGTSRGGRKPVVLSFVDSAYALVGVDVGATHVSVAVTDLRGKLQAWTTKSINVRGKPRETIDLICELIDEALQISGVPKEQLLGIGLGAPSPVNPKQPGRFFPMILPKWEGINLIEEIQKVYGVHVLMDNDANLGALAEAWWGAGREASTLAFIKIAFGIGSGLVINGEIHRGLNGTAGEIGHTSLDANGPQCICGLKGCINMLMGTPRMLQLIQELSHKYPNSKLAARKRPSLQHLVEAAQARDPLAVEVLAIAGDILGTAIGNVLNLLAPEVIILGGYLTEAGEAFIEPVKKKVQGTSLASSMSNAEIKVSSLGQHGIALGAATLILEAVLNDPSLFHTRPQVA